MNHPSFNQTFWEIFDLINLKIEKLSFRARRKKMKAVIGWNNDKKDQKISQILNKVLNIPVYLCPRL